MKLFTLQTKSRTLDDSVREMSCNIGELEAREEELINVLQKKVTDACFACA